MKNIKLTAEEMIIIDRLKQMKMSGMAEAYEEQILNPNSDLSGFYERFSCIVNFEWELRFNKKFNRFLKKATLRYPQASFDDTIYEPDRMLDTETIEQLATCKWLDEGRNLLITGATGAGKSYISNALCIAAISSIAQASPITDSTLSIILYGSCGMGCVKIFIISMVTQKGISIWELHQPILHIPLERNSQSAIAVRLSAPNGKVCSN